MWTLIRLGNKHKKLKVNNILFKILKLHKTQQFILNLNKQDQLFNKGINSENVSLESIGGSYSDNTIYGTNQYPGKLELGLPIDRITLFNTGGFYYSFKLFFTSNEFKIEANPDKDGLNLFTEWGKEVLGLTEDSINKLKVYVLPLIKDEVIKILNDI